MPSATCVASFRFGALIPVSTRPRAGSERYESQNETNYELHVRVNAAAVPNIEELEFL
jgi:hypothetical protein